jgi:two-component system, OmpR family, response regulator BaeR
MEPHILIVEDEKKIADLLGDFLENDGFRTSILNHGDLVIAFVRKKPINLILLDVMLPGKDGLTLCKEIRSFSNIPIIMITARVSEIDRLLGLELGSDDYICKPFSPREAVARVKAVLRRTVPAARKTVISIGPISLDEERHSAMIRAEELVLTPNEFEILRLFMTHPGKVFTRSELLDKVQGYQFEGYERTVDSHIKNLRKKIAGFLPGKTIIQSVYGVGYKLNEPIL